MVREWREGCTRERVRGFSRVVILTVECRGTLARAEREAAAVDGDGGGRGVIREAAPVVTTKLRPPVEADLKRHRKAVWRRGGVGWGIGLNRVEGSGMRERERDKRKRKRKRKRKNWRRVDIGAE